MSEATDRTDDDAWAHASAEDLAGEKARRREQGGQGTGGAAEELRRLVEAVTDKLGELGNPTVTMAAQAVFSQVKSVVEPIRERNPEVVDHLAAAGGELLAAYRAVLARQEHRWTAEGRPGSEPSEHIDLD